MTGTVTTPSNIPFVPPLLSKPTTMDVYPMPINKQNELDRFLNNNLQKEYIVSSKFPIASPVFFIKKKDG